MSLFTENEVTVMKSKTLGWQTDATLMSSLNITDGELTTIIKSIIQKSRSKGMPDWLLCTNVGMTLDELAAFEHVASSSSIPKPQSIEEKLEALERKTYLSIQKMGQRIATLEEKIAFMSNFPTLSATHRTYADANPMYHSHPIPPRQSYPSPYCNDLF